MFDRKDKSKVIVAYPSGVVAEEIKNMSVYLGTKGNVDLEIAFATGEVVPDRFMNYFRQAKDDIERQQKYCDRL